MENVISFFRDQRLGHYTPTRVLIAFLLSLFVSLPLAVYEPYWWLAIGCVLVMLIYRYDRPYTLLMAGGYVTSTICSFAFYLLGWLGSEFLLHLLEKY